jgi:hypothetical protein
MRKKTLWYAEAVLKYTLKIRKAEHGSATT